MLYKRTLFTTQLKRIQAMSLLDDENILIERSETGISVKLKEDLLLVGRLLGKGAVKALVVEEKENFLSKKINEAWNLNLDCKTSFAQRLNGIIQYIANPNQESQKQRPIFSIDCRTLCKGDAYGWLSNIANATKEVADPIIIIENVTQVSDGNRATHDDPMYVTNLLLRSWKNEQIYAGDIHIDRSKFTVLLTCPPQDAHILQRECGVCSYGWIGDFDEFLKETRQIATEMVESKR